MRLTDRRFWLWETVTTVALSAIPLLLYGQSFAAIALIVVSFAIAVAIGLAVPDAIRVPASWFLIFGTSLGAYVIDIFLMAQFRLIRIESFPLIVAQIYIFPVFILVSALICAVGGIIMNKSCRRITLIVFGAIFVVFLSIVGFLWFHMAANDIPADYPTERIKANGLTGHVKSLFFTDSDTGLALSSFTYPDSPDTVKVYRTSDGGQNWRAVAELPDRNAIFNPIRIGDNLFGAVNSDPVYTLLIINIPNGRLTLSPGILSRLPTLFESDGRPGYTADGVFYLTDPSFATADSIGAYDLHPTNSGIAIISDHIFGFYFDTDSCVSRLYDFTDRTLVDNFSTPGYASLIKSDEKSCLILAARDRYYLEMSELNADNLTLERKSMCAFKMMEPLLADRGTVYTLLADGPDANKWLMFGDASWQSRAFRNLKASNITAYCMVGDRFIYYDPFSHEIVKIDIKPEEP